MKDGKTYSQLTAYIVKPRYYIKGLGYARIYTDSYLGENSVNNAVSN